MTEWQFLVILYYVIYKMAIFTYIMKIAENDPFLRFQMRAIEMFNRPQFVFL